MRRSRLRSTLIDAVGPAVFLTLLAGAFFGLAPVYAQAPEQSRDFFGFVLSIEGDNLIVAVDGDVIEVTVDSDTSVRLPFMAGAAITDLAEGDQIAVSLDVDGTAVADKIFLIPTKTRFRHVFGTVTAISDIQIVVQPTSADADSITFDLTDSTKINLRGVTSQLEVGVRVVIVVERDEETGEIAVEAIEITVVRPTADVESSQIADTRVTTTPASIKGVFQRIESSGRWVVSGTVVVVSVDTAIDQGIVVGEEIEIDGYLSSDDTISATEIRRVVKQQVARRARFEGVFEGEDAEGQWIINGHAMIVDDRSDTDGLPDVGESVIVSAVELDDGTLVIREIENIGFTRKSLEAKKVTLQGTLKAQVGDGLWRINAFLVKLNGDTTITGRVAVGSPVRVSALRRSTGGLLAISIEGLSRNEPQVEKTVTIEGIVTRIGEDGTIEVGERTINTSDLTEIEGDLTEGVQVKVSAVITDDRALSARRVEIRTATATSETRQVEIEGIVESINGTIVVSGVTVIRNKDTQIDGNVAVGAQVTVIGWIDADGLLVARVVRGEDRGTTRNGTEVRLTGEIKRVERIDDNQVTAIRVDNTTVVIVELTRIDVRLNASIEVVVHGVIVDGQVVARTIQPRVVLDSDGDHPTSTRSLTGVIESIHATANSRVSVLVVNGIDIGLIDSTKIEGELAVGANVTVEGFVEDDTFLALSAKVNAKSNASVIGRPFELAGRVSAVVRNRADGLAGIVISGRTIKAIPGRTQIEGTLVAGAAVKIDGRILDGTPVAVTIVVTAGPVVNVQPEPEPVPTVTSTVSAISAIRGRVQDVVTGARGRVTHITVNGLQVAVGAHLKIPNLLKRGDTVEIHVGMTDAGVVAIRIRLIARAEVIEEPDEPATTTPAEIKSPVVTIFGRIATVRFDQSDRAAALSIDGSPISVNARTVIRGSVRQGARAEVEARQVDGRLVAIKIEVAEDVDQATIRAVGTVRR